MAVRKGQRRGRHYPRGDLPVAALDAIPDSPPLFSYGSSSAFADIPFPDFTFWGNTGRSQQRTWQVIPVQCSILIYLGV